MSTITIKTAELLDAIKVVFPTSQKRTTMPTLNHILVTVAGGLMSLGASDSQNWMVVGHIACTGDDMRFSIPARLLRIAIESAELEDTAITMAGGWVTITSGGSSAKFGVLAPEEFIAWPAVIGGWKFQTTLDQAKLKEALNLAVVATSSVIPERNAVALEFRGEFMLVRSYGGAQYSQVSVAPVVTASTLNACVQSETAKLIAGLLGGDELVELQFSDNLVLVTIGGISLTCLLSGWNYGSLDDGLNQLLEQLSGRATVDTEALRSALSTVAKLFNENFTTFDLGFKDGAITVDYMTPESEVHNTIPATVNGPEAKIRLQPRLLLGYLSELEAEQIELSYLNASKPVEIQQVGSHAYLYMVMPIRPE